MSENIRDRLRRLHLLVVTGKGGVGKTAVSACLGRSLARGGSRVVVLEVDPRENLHQMLGIAPSGGEILSAGDRLFVQNLKPRAVLDALVRERLKLDALARRVLSSPVYEHFSEGAPGLKEVAVLGHALRLIRGTAQRRLGAFDCVVLDAPATGHGVSLLSAPRLLSEVIRKGPFADLGRRLAEFVDDRERCGVVVVTLAEEMPVQEALELRLGLEERLDRTPELLVINGVYPPARSRPSEDVEDAGEDPEDPIAELWRRRRGVNESEIERLERHWPGPKIEVPKLPFDRGPELTDAMSASFEAGLASLAAPQGEAV